MSAPVDLGALPRMSIKELRDLWREHIGRAPPPVQKRLLIRELAWRIQERIHGGLDAETARLLKSAIRNARQSTQNVDSSEQPRRSRGGSVSSTARGPAAPSTPASPPRAGLEQAFNSLDAQREACERYIAAHAHDGWEVTAERYDDGGFTGANTERPAFRRLLADVEAGQGRHRGRLQGRPALALALADFARVMDRFNRAGAAFVSVTQNFSTADAMGRLTLNMLMSFAEFEREMIGERTRDKIASASLVHRILTNPIYIGKIVHTRRVVSTAPGARRPESVTEVHDGLHEPIIPRELWDEVHEMMAVATRDTTTRWTHTHLLKGKLRTFEGHTMSPSSTLKRGRRDQGPQPQDRALLRQPEGRQARLRRLPNQVAQRQRHRRPRPGDRG
jgi:DNA invertase Pin-like site-specific DNA recombinase